MKSMSKFFAVILAVFLFGNSGIFAQEAAKAATEAEKITNTGETQDKPKREVSALFKGIGKDTYISGYGALTGSYSRIKGEDAFLPGFRAGLILDNLVIGLSGTCLAHPNKRSDFGDNSYTDGKDYVDFSYGGAMVEYYFFPQKLVHFSIGTVIGGGSLRFSSDRDDDDDNDNRGGDKFFAVEPEANVFINLARFCRVGIGGSYRYINGLDNDTYKDRHFNGANVKLVAAFGWF
ncbi:MAG: hypothetical protein V1874_08085 [Spirochaetota bacterium]